MNDKPVPPRPEDAEEFERAVRRTAYFLWEQDGSPEGRAMDYWLRAREQHLRQREFDRLLAEGDPDSHQ
jgi:hypothetical protein